MSYTAPLVTIIVVNFNYGRFLRPAVDSVFAQKYPNVQCVVVDDASTDNSTEVLDEVARAHPSAHVIRRRENGGQITACLDGLMISEGTYITFLDADDFLFEHFVGAHIYTHLSLRDPAGFSCSDMLQLLDGQMVRAGFPTLGNYIASGPPRADLRQLRLSSDTQWLEAVDKSLPGRTFRVNPTERGWPWSATSGFCFRHDALSLWTQSEAFHRLRRAPDAYLAQGINAITGSILIDEALGAYRVHGANDFSRGIPLANLRNYNSSDEMSKVYRRVLLDETVRDPARFKFHDPSQLLNLFEAFDGPVESTDSLESSSYALKCVLSNYHNVAKSVGEARLNRWIRQRRLRILKSKVSGGRYWSLGRHNYV